MNTDIPFYDIANKFLIGFLFLCGAFMLNFHYVIEFLSKNEKLLQIPTGAETILTICFVALVYEVGVLINRVSSIGTEELFIKIKIFPPRSQYGSFNDAKKHYEILSILAREYDFCKGHTTLFIFLTIFALILYRWQIVILFIIVSVIFTVAGRKHSKRINNLVTKFEDEQPKHKDMMA